MAAVAAIAGVGMMVCCSSSVAAFMMGGDDDDDKKKTPLGPSPGPTGAGSSDGFTYEFHIVSETEHNDHGSVISDIKIDGNRVSKDEITFHIAPTKYDCQHDTDTSYDCEGEMGYLDEGGAITMAAWNKHTPPEKFFTITSPTKISTIEISFHRPTYAPALMIKENGVEILRDDSNGGNEGSPSPNPVKYTIP